MFSSSFLSEWQEINGKQQHHVSVVLACHSRGTFDVWRKKHLSIWKCNLYDVWQYDTRFFVSVKNLKFETQVKLVCNLWQATTTPTKQPRSRLNRFSFFFVLNALKHATLKRTLIGEGAPAMLPLRAKRGQDVSTCSTFQTKFDLRSLKVPHMARVRSGCVWHQLSWFMGNVCFKMFFFFRFKARHRRRKKVSWLEGHPGWMCVRVFLGLRNEKRLESKIETGSGR